MLANPEAKVSSNEKHVEVPSVNIKGNTSPDYDLLSGPITKLKKNQSQINQKQI